MSKITNSNQPGFDGLDEILAPQGEKPSLFALEGKKEGDQQVGSEPSPAETAPDEKPKSKNKPKKKKASQEVAAPVEKNEPKAAGTGYFSFACSDETKACFQALAKAYGLTTKALFSAIAEHMRDVYEKQNKKKLEIVVSTPKSRSAQASIFD